MTDFKTFVESDEQVRVIELSFVGRLGEPLQYNERELRNAQSEHDIQYTGQVQKGKRWLQAIVSFQRLNKPGWSYHNGELTGAVWCLGENKEACLQALIESGKKVIESYIESWKVSLDSLDSPQM